MKQWKFEELTKQFSDTFYYLVGVAMDGSKGGWREKLFVWCFVLAVVIALVLLVKPFFGPFL